MKPRRLESGRSPRPAAALLGAWLFGACQLPALTGCGQKGPLFLPDPKPQAVPAAPAAPTDTPATRKAPRTPDPTAQR